jgi:hypothetical protein
MSENDRDLTEVAQFLTSFQGYFHADDEVLGRIISAKEVQNAIEYQEFLEDMTRTRYSLSLRNGAKATGKDLDLTKRLEERVKQIRDTSGDVKLIHRMLKRFEVWMTKDLTRSMFMPFSHNETAGAAPLLNFPNAASLGLQVPTERVSCPRKRRRDNESQPSSTTLMLPPNRWTWHEYFRLSYMVSMLKTPDAIFKANQSFASAATVVLCRRDVSTQKRALTAADLVALWVRAQRNTCAWRHLTQLFTFEKVRRQPEEVAITHDNKSGKRLDARRREDDHDNSEEYAATYVGHDSKALTGSLKYSILMDNLVEWAVVNQVLFTQMYLTEGIESSSIPEISFDVPAEALEGHPSQEPLVQSPTSEFPLTERQTEHSRPTEERVALYTQNASLVGTVLLILPGDRVLDIPATLLKQPLIRMGDKPTPFIVASYMPSYFVKLKPGTFVEDADFVQNDRHDGMFHLLPVICLRQLTYLQGFMKMRQPVPSPKAHVSREWAKMRIIDLPGVVSLTPRQLLRRLTRSKAIDRSIGIAVAKKASIGDDTGYAEMQCLENQMPDSVEWDDMSRFWSAVTLDERASARMSKIGSFPELRTKESEWPCTYASLIKSTFASNSELIMKLLTSCEAGEEPKPSADYHEDYDRAGLNSSDVRADTSEHDSDWIIVEGTRSPTHQGIADDRMFAMDIVPAGTHDSCPPSGDHNTIKSSGDAARDDSTERLRKVDKSQEGNRGIQESLDLTIQTEFALLPERGAGRAENGYPGSNHKQRALCPNDIARAGPDPTFLTLVESAVVAATLSSGFPILARRLLCPRYRWTQADLQVRIIQDMDKRRIPTLPSEALGLVFSFDYERSLGERGPVIGRELEYVYRTPDKPLNIDSIVAQWLGTSDSERDYCSQGDLRDKYERQHLCHPPGLHRRHRRDNAGQQPSARERFAQAFATSQNGRHHGKCSQRYPNTSSPPLEKVARPFGPEGHSRYPEFTPPGPSDSRLPTSPIVNDHATGADVGLAKENVSPFSGQQSPTEYDAQLLDRRGVTQSAVQFYKDARSGHEHRIRIGRSGTTYDDYTERLRGGGPENDSRPRLGDLPRSDWGRQVVTATVQTRRKGVESEDAMIVGFVNPEKTQLGQDAFVPVDVIFVSNHGLLEAPSTQALPLSTLFVAEAGSEEECIAKAWGERPVGSQPLDDHESTTSASSQSENSCSSSTVANNVDAIYETLDGCFGGVVRSELQRYVPCRLCCGDSTEYIAGAALGCSLASSLLRHQRCSATFAGPTSLLAMSKSLLVHIANNLPPNLRLQPRGGYSQLGGILWQDGRHQDWCSFVKNCSCPRQLAQALVIFLASVDKGKLPLWWTSGGAGWSKACVVMTQPTSSGLALHLYVLDAAITDVLNDEVAGRKVGTH